MDIGLDFDLRLEREKAGLTQREMAEILGVTQSAISRWETEPGEMSVATLKKWAKACGYLESIPGIDAGAPYEQLFEATHMATCYLDQWHEPADAPADAPTSADVATSLRRLVHKPVGVVVGKPDSGKSRLLNTILGSNYLPTGYGPATKLLCFIKHIDDRPTSMDAQVYLLRDGFDLAFSNDVDHIREYRVKSGGIEMLKEYGVHEYQKDGNFDGSARIVTEKASKGQQSKRPSGKIFGRHVLDDIRCALVFLDAPILKATDIIDTPGFSDNRVDVELAFQGIQQSTYLIHCSTATGYMGSAEDRMLMQEAIKRLPLMPSEMGDEPFSNILLLATMAAPYITDADLTKAIDVGIMRLGRHLAMVLPHEIGLRMARSGESSAVPSEADVIAKLRRRAYPLFVEVPARRKQAVSAIQHLVGDSLPEQWEALLNVKVQGLLQRNNTVLQGRIHEFQSRLKNLEKANGELERLKEYEPTRRVFVREKIDEIKSLIYEYREECEAEAKEIAQFYYHWPNLRALIDSRYNEKDQAEAKAGLVPLVTESINREITNALKKRCMALDKAIREFISEYASEVDKAKAEFSADAGDDLNTIGMIAGGGVVAFLGGAVLLGAAILPLAPIVALGMFVAGVIAFLKGSLRSWQEKLAREVSDSLQKANLMKTLVDDNTEFWDKVESNFSRAYEEMEEGYKRHLTYLENAVKDDDGTCFKRDIGYMSRTLDTLKRMPWRRKSVSATEV